MGTTILFMNTKIWRHSVVPFYAQISYWEIQNAQAQRSRELYFPWHCPHPALRACPSAAVWGSLPLRNLSDGLPGQESSGTACRESAHPEDSSLAHSAQLTARCCRPHSDSSPRGKSGPGTPQWSCPCHPLPGQSAAGKHCTGERISCSSREDSTLLQPPPEKISLPRLAGCTLCKWNRVDGKLVLVLGSHGPWLPLHMPSTAPD